MINLRKALDKVLFGLGDKIEEHFSEREMETISCQVICQTGGAPIPDEPSSFEMLKDIAYGTLGCLLPKKYLT